MPPIERAVLGRPGTGRGGVEPTLPRSGPAGLREDTASLIRGLEVLISRLADPARPMPLDLVDRYERALAAGHHSNLLRISVIEERVLARREERT